MKVKKIIAQSMPEAMKKVREELGSDAVILNSKVIQKGGFFGFFTKKNIEVIAAIDEEVGKKKEAIPTIQKNNIKKQTEFNPKQIQSKSEIVEEIRELKAMMQKMSEGSQIIQKFPDPIVEMNAFLRNHEVEDVIREDLLANILEKWYMNSRFEQSNDVKKWLYDDLIEKLSQVEHGGISFQKQYVNIVGPTGVGKTTTIAKIAAQCVLKHKKSVAFITTDTYRIAAIDQLKTYAKILNVPLEVSYTIEDFKKAKDKFKHYDLVLIDTAGRNFRNQKFIDDLKTIIDFNEEMETFLVFSLTSKYTDMQSIYNQFSTLSIDKFIFTKVDETTQYGSMINLLVKYKIGVAYLTNGQNVPDDIVEASPTQIAKTIFEVEKHERSS